MTPPFDHWQLGSTDAGFSDPALFAERSTKFERRIALRNIIEYVAGGFVVLLFGGLTIAAFIKDEPLIALSSLAILVGVFAALRGLRQRGSNLERRPEETCLNHLRRQYDRQYQTLSAVPKWYIGPMVPGIILFYLAITAGAAESLGWARALQGIAIPFAVSTALFAIIVGGNLIGARVLKRKIEELDALA